MGVVRGGAPPCMTGPTSQDLCITKLEMTPSDLKQVFTHTMHMLPIRPPPIWQQAYGDLFQKQQVFLPLSLVPGPYQLSFGVIIAASARTTHTRYGVATIHFGEVVPKSLPDCKEEENKILQK